MFSKLALLFVSLATLSYVSPVRAICNDGEIGVSRNYLLAADGNFYDLLANDCGSFDTSLNNMPCGPLAYEQGSWVQCDGSGRVVTVQDPGKQDWSCHDVLNVQCGGQYKVFACCIRA